MKLERIAGVIVLASAAACSGGDGGGGGGLRGDGPLRGDVVVRVWMQDGDVYYEDAFARFFTNTEPPITAGEWTFPLPADTCDTSSLTIQGDNFDVGDSVRVLTDGFTITALATSAGTANVLYGWVGDGEAGTPVDSLWDVQIAGTEQIPPQAWENVLRIPEMPVVTAPFGYGTGAVVIDAQAELAVNWESVDATLVNIRFYSAGEIVMWCSAENDGSFTIPLSVVESLPASGLIAVEALRARFGEFRDGELNFQGRAVLAAYYDKT